MRNRHKLKRGAPTKILAAMLRACKVAKLHIDSGMSVKDAKQKTASADQLSVHTIDLNWKQWGSWAKADALRAKANALRAKANADQQASFDELVKNIKTFHDEQGQRIDAKKARKLALGVPVCMVRPINGLIDNQPFQRNINSLCDLLSFRSTDSDT